MGLRQWFREMMLGGQAGDEEGPSGAAVVNTLLGRDAERHRSLGEFDAGSYPPELRAAIERREEVTRMLLGLDLAAPEARVAAIPRLRALLGKYPHPLVYEVLINACLDAGRFDEARGVAFAARQRRLECEHSDYPEIRMEVEHVHEWTVSEIDDLRKEER